VDTEQLFDPFADRQGCVQLCAALRRGGGRWARPDHGATVRAVQGTAFDEASFFGAIAQSGARALLIGRQALIVLGLPVLTRDYDFWLHIEDIDAFNAAVAPLELYPSRLPEQARATGRYVLENDEHVDVLVARSVSTVDGTRVAFEDVWARRISVDLAPDLAITLPCIDDLILTKRFGARPRDAEDIRLLRVLRDRGRT